MCCLLTSCSTSGSSLAQLEVRPSDLPVCSIEFHFDGNLARATAVRLSRERLLTCRHNLPPINFAETSINGERAHLTDGHVLNIRSDGQWRPHQFQAAGSGRSPLDDWVVLEPTQSASVSGVNDRAEVNAVRAAQRGDAVLIAGFPQFMHGEILVLPGQVRRNRSDGQMVIHLDERHLSDKWPHGEADWIGLSGGVVMRIGECGQHQIVGMLRAIEATQLLGHTFSHRFLAIPIPPDVRQ